MRSNRQFNRDLSVVCSMNTFIIMKGNWKTSLPMNSATNMSWYIISQNLSGNWYVAKIAMTDKQMVQFIGVRSCSMEEIASLMEIGVIISGWEAARHGFSVARSLATLYYVFVARTTLKEI